MIIDFHAHCFAEKIVDKAMAQLIASCGAPDAFFDGSVPGLLDTMDAAGIDAAVVLNIATNPHQQRAVNDFAIGLAERSPLLSNGCPRLTGFGSVHPQAPDALEELRRLHAAGIKGIKLHPDYQEFFVDDPAMFPIYRETARLGMITVFHAGLDIGIPDPVHCRPAALAKVIPLFGGAPVVAAHFGGYMLWQDVLRGLCGRDGVYLDTSYSARKMPPPWAREILEAHGAERILFGTDLPWSNVADELHYVRQLGASEAELKAILGENAAQLLGFIG